MAQTVVVIGAGHNGLTAACYLARAGLNVTVIEAANDIGGMTASRPMIASAPKHLVSPCAIDAVYWRASTVERDLQLADYGLQMINHDPAWAWLGDDGQSLVLARDVAATITEIRRFSVVDANTYAEFVPTVLRALSVQDVYGMGPACRPSFKTLIEIAHGLSNGRVRSLLGAALSAPAAELIESLFVSRELRGAFASMASILGSITQDSSGIGIFATAPLHRYGVVRPVGGMQAIPDALQRCLLASGGTVRVGCRAQRIELSNGKVKGVTLSDGTSLQADFVLTAVPPHIVSELLEGEENADARTLRHAPANAAGIGCFKVDVALDRQLIPNAHQAKRSDQIDLRKPTLFFGTIEQILRAESEARVGLFPTNPPWTATILSATDQTQAPEGQDTLYLYAPAPVRANGGWAAARLAAENALIGSASGVLGDIAAAQIGRWSESPEDLEVRLGAKNGCIYHIDQIVTRLGPLRPARGWARHSTRIGGLFLSGAGTHPGGGVSGLPGQLAANALLSSMS